MGVCDVVASSNLNADAIFSQLQISGRDPSAKFPPGNGAASRNDFSRLSRSYISVLLPRG